MIKRISNSCRQKIREGRQRSRSWPQQKRSQLGRSLVVATKKEIGGEPQRPRSWPWLRISPTIATKKEKKGRWRSRLWPRPKGSQPRGSLITIANG